MTRLEIVPATRALLTEYYGQPPSKSQRAWVGLIDGTPVGVAGFLLHGQYITLFSDLGQGIRGHKKDIWRAAAFIMDQAKRYKTPVLAIADPDEATAPRFLSRLGFTFVGTCSDGDVYQWQA